MIGCFETRKMLSEGPGFVTRFVTCYEFNGSLRISSIRSRGVELQVEIFQLPGLYDPHRLIFARAVKNHQGRMVVDFVMLSRQLNIDLNASPPVLPSKLASTNLYRIRYFFGMEAEYPT